jgi:hypothetical protein
MKQSHGTGRSRSNAKLTIEEEYIEALKKDPCCGLRVHVSEAEKYRIRIVSRGEQAFYQQNDRALLIEISPIQNALSRRSIRCWDDGAPVSDSERDIIVQRLVDYLTRPGSPPVVISNE